MSEPRIIENRTEPDDCLAQVDAGKDAARCGGPSVLLPYASIRPTPAYRVAVSFNQANLIIGSLFLCIVIASFGSVPVHWVFWAAALLLGIWGLVRCCSIQVMMGVSYPAMALAALAFAALMACNFWIGMVLFPLSVYLATSTRTYYWLNRHGVKVGLLGVSGDDLLRLRSGGIDDGASDVPETSVIDESGDADASR